MTDTKTPSPSDALPCPFCGLSGPLEFQDGSTHRWGVAYCAECGASAGETRREYPDVGDWHAKAIVQWNTRTPQQAQAGAVPLTDEQMAKRTVTYVCPVCAASLERQE